MDKDKEFSVKTCPVDKEYSGKSWSSGHQRWRKWSFIAVHCYILFHFLAFYVFDWPIWGKTAMIGVPSLAALNINAAAIMVIFILLSIFLFGRLFCGWICHLRGTIEFSDWIMQKFKIKTFMRLREKNLLLNTRYRWTLRFIILLLLLLPVMGKYAQGNVHLNLTPETMPPLVDLPGNEGKLFGERSPVNMDIQFNVGDSLIAFGFVLLIVSLMSFVMNLAFGQGAFCRVLCPYPILFAPLMNLNPWQQKITRVGDCQGCRKCSQNCPQGIDVSREIHNFNGKVINRECIKCFRCVDICASNVLANTSKPAVAQLTERKEYIRHPWQNNEEKHMQVFQPLPIWVDALSVIVAVMVGIIVSRLGGFWLYIGALFGLILFRKLMFTLMSAAREQHEKILEKGWGKR